MNHEDFPDMKKHIRDEVGGRMTLLGRTDSHMDVADLVPVYQAKSLMHR